MRRRVAADDAASVEEKAVAARPVARRQAWWEVRTAHNEVRVFLVLYFAWQAATIVAKLGEMSRFLTIALLPRAEGGTICWHLPVMLSPRSHGAAAAALALAFAATAAAIAAPGLVRRRDWPVRALAVVGIGLAKATFQPIGRMASVEKKANMLPWTLLLVVVAPREALAGDVARPCVAWPLTVYRLVIFVAYFNAGVSKVVAPVAGAGAVEMDAVNTWLPMVGASLLRGATHLVVDWGDGATMRGALANHLAFRP